MELMNSRAAARESEPDARRRAACALCGGKAFRSLYGELHTAIGFRYGRCTQCGLVQHIEWRAEEFAHDFYRTRYHQLAHKAAEPLSRGIIFAELLRRLASLVPPGRLLDVGCGPGDFVAAARVAGWDAEGLEISPDAVEIGRRKHGVPLHCGILQDFTAESGAYRCITFWNVLDQIADPAGTVRLACALLSGDGLLALRVPNGSVHHALRAACSRTPRMVKRFGLADLFSVHPISFTPATLRRMLAEGGFREIQILNAPVSSGDPSGALAGGHRRLLGLGKTVGSALARLVQCATFRRVCLAPSLLAFARPAPPGLSNR